MQPDSTRVHADGGVSGARIAIYTLALLTGTEFLDVGTVAILSSATPISSGPDGFALTGELALLLGSERLARSPATRASALLVGLATLLGAWPAVGVASLALVSAADAGFHRPLERSGNVAVPGLVALLAGVHGSRT